MPSHRRPAVELCSTSTSASQTQTKQLRHDSDSLSFPAPAAADDPPLEQRPRCGFQEDKDGSTAASAFSDPEDPHVVFARLREEIIFAGQLHVGQRRGGCGQGQKVRESTLLPEEIIAQTMQNCDPQFRQTVLNSGQKGSGSTLLHEAAWVGRVEAVAELLKHGADVWKQDVWGSSAVHLAYEETSWAAKGHTEVVFLLLSEDQPVLEEDSVGSSRTGSSGDGEGRENNGDPDGETSKEWHSKPHGANRQKHVSSLVLRRRHDGKNALDLAGGASAETHQLMLTLLADEERREAKANPGLVSMGGLLRGGLVTSSLRGRWWFLLFALAGACAVYGVIAWTLGGDGGSKW